MTGMITPKRRRILRENRPWDSYNRQVSSQTARQAMPINGTLDIVTLNDTHSSD